ncbi:hypothetical protein POVCU2_0018350 [Plasmodium ovale curtisi]|uniref:Uncharacterized protein n=1 Tax=Plasmodium ovale curtisi TaxID=864141 RepID=A0A1A8WCF4_PLAOA|nr:hypothetical protein POVCU2_0018350 [Plasmodium ovale curtisi]SBS89424.1 hypothetical protein POVCU1_016550 [Plasmodium ovale curtisi]
MDEEDNQRGYADISHVWGMTRGSVYVTDNFKKLLVAKVLKQKKNADTKRWIEKVWGKCSQNDEERVRKMVRNVFAKWWGKCSQNCGENVRKIVGKRRRDCFV